MSKYINVNPDHYKLAGRERQGENVIHDWWFVLVNWDLLPYDQAIGRAFHAAGFFLFATSIGLGIAFAGEGEPRPDPDAAR